MNGVQAPFPWFGGKSRVADEVWQRFGDTPNYVEPFAGSLAVLLSRPATHRGKIATVNDLDGYLANFWRAVTADPEAVAHWCDWPVSECDLHARHSWLVQHRDEMTGRLMGDPDFFDAKVAGWWVWGICSWIGSGWCTGEGPWVIVDGQLVLSDAGRGVNRQLPHLGNAGRGVNRQLPHLSNAGRGVNRQLPHLSNAGQVAEWFHRIAERTRGTRICCGDWTRVVTESVTFRHGTTAVFLDPPYGDEIKQTRIYASDSGTVSDDVRQWCVDNGDNAALRIALCGYSGEGHETLQDHGWTVHQWRSAGGYGGGRGGTGDTNRRLERIWYSPHCLTNQGDLFDLLDGGGAA